MNAIVAIGAAYLIGAVPIGFLIGRAFGVADIRRHGSGTIGATNVLRTAGWLPALLTLAGDVAKGYLAVVVGAWLAASQTGSDTAVMAASAVAAVIGNCWSVFLGFRGGKGVATYIGVLLGIAWPAAVVFCVVWLAVAAATRYSSLAALTASLAAPAYLWWQGDITDAWVFLLLSILLWIMHRANIERLLQGTESRIGRSAKVR